MNTETAKALCKNALAMLCELTEIKDIASARLFLTGYACGSLYEIGRIVTITPEEQANYVNELVFYVLKHWSIPLERIAVIRSSHEEWKKWWAEPLPEGEVKP